MVGTASGHWVSYRPRVVTEQLRTPLTRPFLFELKRQAAPDADV